MIKCKSLFRHKVQRTFCWSMESPSDQWECVETMFEEDLPGGLPQSEITRWLDESLWFEGIGRLGPAYERM